MCVCVTSDPTCVTSDPACVTSDPTCVNSDPACVDVYHVQYCLPSSTEVAKRLTVEPGGLELMKKRLSEYHRHSPSLLNCYSNVSKSFNVDQPLGDIFEEGNRSLY